MPRNLGSASGPQQPPGLEHHLGVRVGAEADAAGGQLGPQGLVVVQLAVVDEGQAGLAERLVGGLGQVDDRQPPVAELDRDPVVLVAVDPGRVRAAVRDPVGHDVGQLLAVRLLVAAGDSAHVRPRSGAMSAPRRRSAPGRPPGRRRCWWLQASSCSTRARPSLPIRARRGSSSISSTIASRVLAAIVVRARRTRAASPADTRVSRRSKATTGSSNAMYSIVLFIVDTSLSGFFGSGDRPDVGGGQDPPDRPRPAPAR